MRLMMVSISTCKSLNNFITIRDALGKWGAMAVRFLFATSHYRSPINFTETSMASAKAGFEKLQNTARDAQRRVHELSSGKKDSLFVKKIREQKKLFIQAMDNDFDAPKASAALFEVSRLMNSYKGTKQTLEEALKLFMELSDVLGFVFETSVAVPKFIEDLVLKRDVARKNKDWKRSDELRREIEEHGFSVDDTSSGTVVRKK